MSSQRCALAISLAVLVTMSLAVAARGAIADGGSANTVRGAHDRSEVA